MLGSSVRISRIFKEHNRYAPGRGVTRDTGPLATIGSSCNGWGKRPLEKSVEQKNFSNQIEPKWELARSAVKKLTSGRLFATFNPR